MATKTAAKFWTLDKTHPWILIVGGAVGLISSFILSLDKLRFLENPNFVPNCDINPVISCGDVMQSAQGSAFGFPNPWLGLIAFAALITIGVAMLAGAKFARWFWIGLQIGIALGVIFALWLLYESVYTINALCPYCLATDVAVITMLWYNTLYLFDKKYLQVPKKYQPAVTFARKHHLDILLATFVLFVIVILNHFWYYYGQLL